MPTGPIESKIAILGHPAHPMVVHFPVAALIALIATDTAYIYTQNFFWAKAGLWLAGAGTVVGTFAAILGWIEQLIVSKIRNLITASCHGVAAIMMLSLAAFNWLLRIHSPEQLIFPWGIYISFLTGIMIWVTSFLGGKLVYEYGVGVDINC